MITKLKAFLRDDGLKARAARGVSMSMVSMFGENFLRLISNLILTRLLAPEAFGLMAIVGVFIAGLQMFSDFGVRASIVQSKRGDDPDYLNTAWTMQILRGGVLALCCAVIAYPVAVLYDEPILFPLILANGLNPLISGFITTNTATARRNIYLARFVTLKLIAQTLNIVLMSILAYLTQSVWSLLAGSIFGVCLQLVLYRAYLPGIVNRLRWEKEAAVEIFHFGKFVFLSTMVSFLLTQGDKLILGLFISTALLGIYNIGYVMGHLPVVLIRAVTNTVVFPLYRMRPPAESAHNQANIFRAQRGLIAGALGVNIILGLFGIPLVDFLYDDRYSLAGPVIVLMAIANVPLVIFDVYAKALMAHGDTKKMFQIQLITVLVQITLLLPGVKYFGIAGAIIAPGVATLLTYPVLRGYVSRYKALDTKGDMLFLIAGVAVSGLLCWYHRAELMQLFTAGTAA